MDPSISWLQPEQEGPAKQLWLRIWQTQQESDNMNLKEGDSELETITNGYTTHRVGLMNGKTDKNATFSRRRKDNRPVTRSVHRKLSSDYGGCPWRQPNFPYQKGVVG